MVSFSASHNPSKSSESDDREHKKDEPSFRMAGHLGSELQTEIRHSGLLSAVRLTPIAPVT